MGWRESYKLLLDLFPQVDSRLMKGAALEHGDDLWAAVEFILTDVVGVDEANSRSQHLPDTTTHHASANSIQELGQRRGSAGEEQAVAATGFGTSVGDWKRDERFVIASSPSEALPITESQSYFTEQEVGETTGDSLNESRDGILKSDEIRDKIKPEIPYAIAGGSSEVVEEDELGLANIVRQIFLLSRRKKDQVHTGDISTPLTSASQEDKHKRGGEVGHLSLGDSVTRAATEEDKSVVQSQVLLCDLSTPKPTLAQDEGPAVSEEDGVREAVDRSLALDEKLPEFPVEESGPPAGIEGGQGFKSDFDQDTSQIKEHKEQKIVSHEETKKPDVLRLDSDYVYTSQTRSMADEFLVSDESISVRKLSDEGFEVSFNDGLDSMTAIEIDIGLDPADWENVNGVSFIQMNQMEPLGNLVEDAKADKEALISSIEEIRLLRLMTDQAEYAARQSRDEAAQGGVDVIAKVDEMRKILSRAREANAVHAGEVFGEKAVLATEARELHYRLAQLKVEKAKAVAALEEIKASLQARINTAVREREAAEQEKIEKEFLAKGALAKEEALMAKVAQESRDLDAEAEACTKIREFLVERGSIVDALQGEVGVLREDAESLKKDLESMSLYPSGFHVNTLSRAGSEMYNSIVSNSGKFGQPSENVDQVESGPVANSDSGSASLSSVSGLQKSGSERKLWSSLPSLLSGLSGSQDLTGSSHSGYNSSHTSNSVGSSRDASDCNQGGISQLGSENLLGDMKFLSSPNYPSSPEEKRQEERDLLKVKMAMFPGEGSEMGYMGEGVSNLDVFRAEKPLGPGGETDDDDWQVLEKASSKSSEASGDI